jgi:TolA-binding protein
MSTEPTSPEVFDPVDFWEFNKTKIIAYAALLIIGLGGYGAYELNKQSRAAKAETLFAEAKTAEDFDKIQKEFQGSRIGGNAMLEQADKLRAENKLEDAAKLLVEFVALYSEHPLASGGWTSLGVTYELQGKQDEAMTAYQQVVTAYANSYSAPTAMLAQARIWIAKGKPEEARRLYQDVSVRYPGTVGSRLAMRELKYLPK